jgi:hypothetical protein
VAAITTGYAAKRRTIRGAAATWRFWSISVNQRGKVIRLIEANHDAYVRHGAIAMSDSVSRKARLLQRSAPRASLQP